MAENVAESGSEERIGMNAGLGDPWVLGISAGFVIAFVALSAYDVNLLSELVSGGFTWTAKYLGSFFQAILLLTFFIAIGVAVSPAASAKMGNLDQPEMSTFKWVSIIMCTLLAGGGVFFAAFVIGLALSARRYVETGVAGAAAGATVAVANVLGVGFLPIGIDYLQQWGLPLLAVGGGIGLVVALLGHYFGRDLRAGLTADVDG